jgi:hypothetical protein
VQICGDWLPASDPGDVSAKGVAEFDHGGVQLGLGEGGPEFQLVALAAAFVAAVAPLGDVDGEVSGTSGGGAVQGASSVPLVAGTAEGLTGRGTAGGVFARVMHEDDG